jgi:3-oxoacyl-(acyl-carrier-protein) synthase
MTNIYINGLGNVSPQKTTGNDGACPVATTGFLTNPISYETNQLKCIDPGYKDFIPAEMIRRMSRIIRMGVASAKLCLRDAVCILNQDEGTEITPQAIITGSGLGCIEDTEKFLASMIRNREEFLTPTSFIQSTHNTVAGQIALLLNCHGYNFTYVHRGISFESALIDAMTQLQLGEFSNVLVGGSDELTANSFAITSRFGLWKQKPIQSLDLLKDNNRGTIAGEGSSFFFLENQKHAQSYARFSGVSTFLKPASDVELRSKLYDFLESHGLKVGDISLLILGLNGDPQSDHIYHQLADSDFKDTLCGYYKHLCGEYHTSPAFAMWLGAMVIKNQVVPEVTMVKIRPQATGYEHVLIYNNFRGNNHSFILLSRP